MKFLRVVFQARTGGLLLSLVAVLLLTGCLTPKLWKTNDFSQSAYPAAPANLEVFKEPSYGRLLVRYHEYSEKKNAVTERAYWLTENRETVEAGKKPKFVEIGNLKGLEPLPACMDTAECTVRATAALAAYVPLKDGHAFLVCRPGFQDGPFSLPAYDERRGTTTKVLLTPLAVIGDTVIVGSVVGILFAYLYAQGGGGTL